MALYEHVEDRVPHKSGLPYFEGLPADVVVEVADDPALLPSSTAGSWSAVRRSSTRLSLRGLIGELPDLRVIQLPSAGSDAWAGIVPAGVTLADARGAHDSATAEWVITAILASLRNFPAFQRAQHARQWAHDWLTPTRELRGRRVLIIGAGNIGTAVARRARGLRGGADAGRRTARPGTGVRGTAELPGLLPEADVVVLLTPLNDETRGLVDAEFLAALPDDALVVNAARGPVVDSKALYAELELGRISAALDVTGPRPLPSDDPLWTLPTSSITRTRGRSPRGCRIGSTASPPPRPAATSPVSR